MSKKTYQLHTARMAQMVETVNKLMMKVFNEVANERDLTQFERITMLFKMFRMVARVADDGRKNMKTLFMEATQNGN